MICLDPNIPEDLRARLLVCLNHGDYGRSLGETVCLRAWGHLTSEEAEQEERFLLSSALLGGGVEGRDPEVFRLMYRLLVGAVHRDIARYDRMTALDASDLITAAAAMERDAMVALPPQDADFGDVDHAVRSKPITPFG